MALYRCYIDEAGDEGFRFDRHSSPWFFLAGVLVKEEYDKQVRGTVDSILEKLWMDKGQKPPAVLHWRSLSHSKKLFVADRLKEQPFCQISVGIWKTQLDRTAFICQPDNLFRYASRLLLERISWYVDDKGGRVLIIFSNRNRFDLGLLRSYVTLILKSDKGQIKPVFNPDEICVRNADQLRMLQVADARASAVGNAFNPDDLGYTHPYYLLKIAGRFYSRNGKLFSYGLKLFPDAAFLRHYPTEFPFMEQLMEQK